MDLRTHPTLVIFLVLELVQLVIFWMIIHYRYRLSLRQMSRLTGQLSTGQRPKSYYIDGPPVVGQVSRHLESVGAMLDKFHRLEHEEDSNLNVLLANMVEATAASDVGL